MNCLYYSPQRSWGKVIFLVACVKNSVHRGEYLGRYPPKQVHTPRKVHPMGKYTPRAGTHPQAGTCPPGSYTPGQVHSPLGRYIPHGSLSGQYASYWNAFLFEQMFPTLLQKETLQSSFIFVQACLSSLKYLT